MFVRSTMKPVYQCFVASTEQTVKKALELMNEKDIQAMPVINKQGIFCGMVSKQGIYKASFYEDKEQSKFLEDTTVKEIMTHEDLYITEDDVFENTLKSFKAFPILAVVNQDKKFIGIVSRFDVIEQFESTFGKKKTGLRISFTSEESSGRFARLADIMKHLHVNIISITTFDETDKLARRIVLKVDEGVNVDKLKRKLERAGFRVLDIKKV
ncbi:hypothetical protein GCM10011351_05660 [Paraliobacillus quinghaiensis]|uniref:CBS domain-containing protein n=1 Tax=Paraliobacillus quinghaiensis TaxID=470815 RepID=A0A917WQ92_9BACI|nr:CBS domain-containing protein [Paraliobacillus quinghaiensis]GGM22684.1 hypothetical protein GCM10011351_05660 [Paraliobacillus quinghaiensis]